MKFDLPTDKGIRSGLPISFECTVLLEVIRDGVVNSNLLGSNSKCQFLADDTLEVMLGKLPFFSSPH